MSTVTIDRFEGLDPKTWWRLATEAEGRGITVRELLAEQNTPPAPVPLSRLEMLSAELSVARASGFRVPRRERSTDELWLLEQERQHRLSSFRRMDTVWEETA